MKVINTTGGALFAEGPGHSAKAQKPSAKALPSTALGKEPSAMADTTARGEEGRLGAGRPPVEPGRPGAATGGRRQWWLGWKRGASVGHGAAAGGS